MLDMEANK
jgi:hypothetical protein